MSPATPPVALVLGANGRLGAATVQAFAAAGWAVCAQARRAPSASLPPGATYVALPLDDAANLAAAAAGARIVVYAVNPLYTQWAAQAMPLLAQGIAVARRLNAVLMLPGNVYNFGAGMPPVLSERTPQQPTTRKGRVRVQMEGELRALAGRGELRSIVVRAGDFFGGGTGSWLDLVITKSLQRGKLVYPGPLDVPHAWAYLPDLARAFVAAASHAGELPPFADLPFAGHTLTGAQLLDAIERAARALGVAPAGGAAFKRGGMPWPLLKLGGLVVPMLREIAEMSYLWRVPHALDGSALQAAVGPLATAPIDDAMPDALRALGFGSPR
ncbi:MAG TPA: NAD-dependent epimerase/dehydratase family protein [Burkholderiaceae bacterium]|nr:NAD-dependent epimerase/dehydratase family protein [Burkholderiaceae bacterium]